MITGDDRWYTVASRLKDAAEAGLTIKPERVCLVPGEIAWDQCECDGQLAVSVARVYPYEIFPQEISAVATPACQAPYEAAEIIISVIRCAPQPQGQDLAPSCAELDTATGVHLQDVSQVLDATSRKLCAMYSSDDVTDYLITSATALGPEGSCVGFALRVLVGLDRA